MKPGSGEWIRARYDVPAWRDGRILWLGEPGKPCRPGTIVGFRDGWLRIRYDDAKEIKTLHPKSVDYLEPGRRRRAVEVLPRWTATTVPSHVSQAARRVLEGHLGHPVPQPGEVIGEMLAAALNAHDTEPPLYPGKWTNENIPADLFGRIYVETRPWLGARPTVVSILNVYESWRMRKIEEWYDNHDAITGKTLRDEHGD